MSPFVLALLLLALVAPGSALVESNANLTDITGLDGLLTFSLVGTLTISSLDPLQGDVVIVGGDSSATLILDVPLSVNGSFTLVNMTISNATLEAAASAEVVVESMLNLSMLEVSAGARLIIINSTLALDCASAGMIQAQICNGQAHYGDVVVSSQRAESAAVVADPMLMTGPLVANHCQLPARGGRDVDQRPCSDAQQVLSRTLPAPSFIVPSLVATHLPGAARAAILSRATAPPSACPPCQESSDFSAIPVAIYMLTCTALLAGNTTNPTSTEVAQMMSSALSISTAASFGVNRFDVISFAVSAPSLRLPVPITLKGPVIITGDELPDRVSSRR